MTLNVNSFTSRLAQPRTLPPNPPTAGAARVNSLSVTVAIRRGAPEPTSQAKVWDGTQWATGAKVWDGAAWQPLKVWDGTSWVT